MITERRSAPDRRRALHALLALLWLLAWAGTGLHEHALDEHRGEQICGVCLASSHGGAAPPAAVFELALPHAEVARDNPAAAALVNVGSHPYRARAPPC